MGKSYEMAFSIGAKVQGNFSSAFKTAASSVQSLQNTINELHQKQSDISSYERTQQALDRVSSKLALAQAQYANMKAAIDKNANASYQEQNALLAKGKQIDELKDKQAQLEAKLQSTGNALQAEGVDVNNLGQESANAANQVEALRQRQEELVTSASGAEEAVGGVAQSLAEVASAIGVTKALKEIAGAFKECAEAAIAFENDMAAVKRTVGGSDEFIGDLGESFKELSTNVPITASELAQIAATAGQLGIAQNKVEEFSTVMAKLATTTDLTADEAATMLAQFANVTGLTDYQRMGSVVAALGDSTATTASKVVAMSQSMAASATIAGMSSTDIMAIAASVGSLGIEAQAGGTAMSQLINTLYKATETGENLEAFASVAGMSAEQFRQAWGESAVNAFSAFISGLNDVERNGRSAIVILDELGLSNVRQQKAILGLASAGDLLANSIQMAGQAWEQNTALEEKAGIMYETTQAKMTMLGNSFQNLKISIGDAFTPVLSSLADALNSVIEPISKWMEANPKLVQGLATAIGIIGGVAAALAAYTIAVKIATVASAAFAAAVPGAKIIMGITAGVALLTGAFVALSGSTEEASQSLEEIDAEFDAVNDRVRKDNEIIDLADKYEQLSNQVKHAVDTTKKMEDFEDIDISLTATPDIDVTPQDFLIDGNNTLTIIGNPQKDIKATAFLDEDGNLVLIKGKPDLSEKISPDEFVSADDGGDHEVTITATADGVTLDVDAFVNGDRNIKFTAEWANKEAMEADLEAFQQAAGTARQNLNVANNDLNSIQRRIGQVEARLLHAPDEKTKSALREELDTLNISLERQQEKVNDLEAEYELAAGKYVITAQAAGTLTTQSEELASIQAALGISTDDVTDSLEGETEAIRDQVKAAKEKAEADKEAAKIEAYSKLSKESKAFAEQWRIVENGNAAIEEYRNQLAGLDSEIETYSHTQSSALDNQLTAVNDIINAMQDREGGISWGWLTDDEEAELNALARLAEEVTGKAYDPQDFMGSIEEWDAFKASIRSGYDSLGDLEGEYAKIGDTIQGVEKDQADAQKSMQTYIETLATAVQLGVMTPEQLRERLTAEFAELENGGAMVETIMAGVEASIIDATEATEDLGEATEHLLTTDEAQEALQPYLDQIDKLTEAYNSAYSAAYKSMSGQFDLFEQAGEIVPDQEKTIQNYIDALKSQAQYIQDYSYNMQEAQRMGLDQGIIDQLSDGSKESAAILANIVQNGSGRIDELNTEFKKVEKGKEEFAAEVAEMQTDFSSQMDEMVNSLQAAVANMNLSSEAATAAGATVDAYAAAAKSKISTVQEAFKSVSEAAKNGLAEGAKGEEGYASGTQSATPGFHLVGENGPEMVFMHGGEQVLDATETARALDGMSLGAEPAQALSASSGGSYNIEYKPQYNITGSVDNGELQSVLAEHDAGLRDMLEEMLDDIQNDRTRRRYA